MLRPAISTALANSVAEGDLGVAGASERLANQIGIVFGITVMATVYASDVDRLPLAFLVGAGFGVLGALVALRMRSAAPVEEALAAPAPVDPAAGAPARSMPTGAASPPR